MADASGLAARDPAKHTSDADVGGAPDRPAQAGDGAGKAGGAAMRVGNALITPPGGPRGMPDEVVRRGDSDAPTAPAQKRARLESQACFPRNPPFRDSGLVLG